MNRRLALLTLAAGPLGCGYLLHPERRGTQSGHIDGATMVMDLLWLLAGIIPGVVALIVDFSSGAIYVRGGSALRLEPGGRLAVRLPRSPIRHGSSFDWSRPRTVLSRASWPRSDPLPAKVSRSSSTSAIRPSPTRRFTSRSSPRPGPAPDCRPRSSSVRKRTNADVHHQAQRGGDRQDARAAAAYEGVTRVGWRTPHLCTDSRRDRLRDKSKTGDVSSDRGGDRVIGSANSPECGLAVCVGRICPRHWRGSSQVRAIAQLR